MANNITGYNPDVLSCLANLSNDEVFTPPEVANAMLDMLPQELFADPDTKFLDPATKSGVFLREIAKRCLAAQLPGYEDALRIIDQKKMEGSPLSADDEAFQAQLQETIDHIFHEQLFGIAITELTSLLSRRSLYCSKYPNSKYSVTLFDDTSGNIRFKNVKHRWKDGKCVFCGVAQSNDTYTRDDMEVHAYEFIHTVSPKDIFDMKFDVIIGNPPYQSYTNTEERIAAKQARPLFHLFVEQAKKLRPRYMSMIIPARWYSGGIGLADFRETMLHDPHITKLIDFVNSKDCFDGVDIAGGICYFLWDRDNNATCEITNIIGHDSFTSNRPLDEFGSVFIRSNISIPIIHKVLSKAEDTMDNQVYSLDPFGFSTSARGEAKPFTGCIKLIHSKGTGFVKRDDVQKNANLIDKYKVTIARVVPGNGEVGVDPAKGYRATTNPRLLLPGEVNTFSYMLLGAFDTEEEAVNFRSYMRNKLPRFLLRLTYSSMNIAKTNFMFVPKMDFTKLWDDTSLYDYFELNEEERELVENTIRPFDEGEE